MVNANNPSNAVYHATDQGPTWGGYDTQHGHATFCGSNRFVVQDMEVFHRRI